MQLTPVMGRNFLAQGILCKMLARLRSSIAYRAKWAELGIYYIKSLHLDSVQIAGRQLKFPPNERADQEHEFHEIVIDDCYQLNEIKEPVRPILDIGANIGLFAIAPDIISRPRRFIAMNLIEHSRNILPRIVPVSVHNT